MSDGTDKVPSDFIETSLTPSSSPVKSRPQFIDKVRVSATALTNEAVTASKRGEYHLAVKKLEQAINLDPSLLLAHLECAFCCEKLGELHHATHYYHQALLLDPNNIQAKTRLAMVSLGLSLFADAISLLNAALKLAPSSPGILSTLLMAFQHVCDWQALEAIKQDVMMANNQLLNENKCSALTPFNTMTLFDDPEFNLKVARSYAQYIEQFMNAAYLCKKHVVPAHNAHRKIRIGYLSAGLKSCPNSYLGVGLFEQYDRDMFEVFAFAVNKNEKDCYQQRIKSSCDGYINLYQASYAEAAEMIFKHKIDILVELDGYLTQNYLPACALRPAPVQMHYLGFPGTLGASFLDYFIADKIVVPKNQQQHFQEKIIYLPYSYQVNDNSIKINKTLFQRQDFNLPDDAIVFCCFNNLYKITRETFDSWCRILSAVPNAVLWLWDLSPLTKMNLRQAVENLHISPSRLVFSSGMPREQHLSRLTLADLMLDTFTCNAHTTATDALIAGIPLITLQGKHFASRVASSLLTAIELPELITDDMNSYESLAISLAKQPEKLVALKNKLIDKQTVAPLLNTTKTVSYLQKAYQTVWERYVTKQPLTHIEVSP